MNIHDITSFLFQFGFGCLFISGISNLISIACEFCNKLTISFYATNISFISFLICLFSVTVAVLNVVIFKL